MKKDASYRFNKKDYPKFWNLIADKNKPLMFTSWLFKS